ncbi:MAG: tetratricopeptide repeat protein [Muribaculaceae bacterium]|nr:tetratricopeptide repeat protein [Muribaculaceae bacterium]
MKIKLILSMLVAGSLAAGAQSQGYKDGIEYYKAGQYDNAKEILARTINDAATEKATAYYYMGQTELAKGDKAAAKKYFDQGIAADAENPYNYVGLGALDLLNGNADAAKDNFKQAQKFGKKNSEITVDIARAYYNADPVAYAKDIEKQLEKAHKDSKDKEPAIYILEGDMAAARQDWGAAAGKYEMAITFEQDNPEGYVKYANAYFNVNPAFSIQKLEELLKQTPNSALAQRELAEKYYQSNHWKKASDLYGQYIQNPNHFPQDKARYSVLLYWGEDYPKSLQVAEEVLAQDPSNFQAQRLRFIDQVKLKDYQNAVKNAEAFFAANASNPLVNSNDYVTYAEALSGLGQDSLAVLQYEAAVKRFPDNGDLLKEISSVYTANKNYVKAAEAYDAYVQTLAEPSLNDMFTASGRYLNAAATAGDNIEQREKAAARGLEYVNKAIAGAEPQAALYQRLGRLSMARNAGNTMDEKAAEAYLKVVELLDADAANMDAANANNQLGLYKEAYMLLYVYYGNVAHDKDKAAEYAEKLNNVNTLLGQ